MALRIGWRVLSLTVSALEELMEWRRRGVLAGAQPVAPSNNAVKDAFRSSFRSLIQDLM